MEEVMSQLTKAPDCQTDWAKNKWAGPVGRYGR